MLTRLKVSGFKNLVDTDIRLGPFTCIAGANGVGKSNLFDAIRFLSGLADRPLVDAAMSIRDEGGHTTDVKSLFHRLGDRYSDRMSFEAEMIVPLEGVDDLGQPAKASITFLNYKVVLAHRPGNGYDRPGNLEILKEELVHVNQQDAYKHLLFEHRQNWRKSIVQGSRRVPYFISTEGEGPERVIKLHQDGGIKGRPLARLASKLPRTVLSVANAAESPTVLMAKREMQSWRLLQLEPSALRKPDEFTAPTQLGADGSHLPATLYHLAKKFLIKNLHQSSESQESEQVYALVANRLAELIDDVLEVSIERDERRELLTLMVTDQNRTSYPARALSDGTLRFLALAVLELDPAARGLLCFEEPENGIHPERIPAMLRLLQDIVVDTAKPVGLDNPLRQVIINTHSPALVSQVPDESLVVAELKGIIHNGTPFKAAQFSCLPDTWRHKAPERPHLVSRGALLTYLNPVTSPEVETEHWEYSERLSQRPKTRRVIDRKDLRQLSLLAELEE